MSFEGHENDDQYRYAKRAGKNGRSTNEGSERFCCHVDELPDDVDGKVGIHGVLAVFVKTLAAPSREDFSPVSTVGRIGELEAGADEDPPPCGAASPTPDSDPSAALMTVFSAVSFSASLNKGVETSALRLAALR